MARVVSVADTYDALTTKRSYNDPMKPTEVAYFNHGVPVHAGVGYYDALRKLIFFSDAGGFKVLQIEPQVRARLGL